jgi:ribonuclease E
MEVTRKRIRPDAVQETSVGCPTCHGSGYIPSMEAVFGSIDRWLRRYRAKKGDNEVSIALSPSMVDWVTSNRSALFKYLERTHKTKIQILEDDDANVGDFRFFSGRNGQDITQEISVA